MTDTLAIARKLEAAGIDRKAAEATADAIRQGVQEHHGYFATKNDLAALERRMYMVQIAVAGVLFTALQLF